MRKYFWTLFSSFWKQFIHLFKDNRKRHLYYFFLANQVKAGTKIYSLTQCSLSVDECDWYILAGNDERINSHCLTRGAQSDLNHIFILSKMLRDFDGFCTKWEHSDSTVGEEHAILSFRGHQKILTGFYNGGQWENIFLSINWLWYSQIFQQEVGLKHVLCWKSENIRGIPKLTGKIPT